jgi:predicted site-specific integrase-resolvase
MQTSHTAPAHTLDIKLDSPVSFAGLVNVTPQTVRNWIRRGIIPTVISAGKIVRFERAAAIEALRGRAAQ